MEEGRRRRRRREDVGPCDGAREDDNGAVRTNLHLFRVDGGALWLMVPYLLGADGLPLRYFEILSITVGKTPIEWS